MSNQIHVSPITRVRHSAFVPSKVTTLQRDPPDTMGALDGSAKDLNRFLRELIDMTGQNDGAHDVPVLELQFGDILTMTSMSNAWGASWLSITAFLPRMNQSEYQPLSSVPFKMPASLAREYEFLWHADEGRYVVIRKIAIANLTDERKVMDAILDTSDQASKWFAAVGVYTQSLK